MQRQKIALVVSDISCVGKCSLTASLPIISAMGITAAALPTSVLSTHTAFKGATFRDLTGDFDDIITHWKSIGVQFDAIYTGYLGESVDLKLMHRLFDSFPDALRLVDPVMADNGRLYSGFSEDFPQKIRELCGRADVIVPNMTEALLLLGADYAEPPYEKRFVENVIGRLAEIIPAKIVLTGMSFKPGEVGAAVYDRESIRYTMSPRIDGYFHGTGDIFASVLLGALLNKHSLTDAAELAARFTSEAISRTDRGCDSRFGVNFEAALPMLLRL